MFTVALLLVAFTLIGVIVATTTRRRPRTPVPPVRFTHAQPNTEPAEERDGKATK